MSTKAQISGGVSALKAAFESAQTAMAQEYGSAGGGSGGGFGCGEDTGSVTRRENNHLVKVVPLEEAKVLTASFSLAGRMARHMGSIMVNGAAEYQTMKQNSNSFGAHQTIGEELATQIRKQTATRRDNREHDDFAGDSLSGNNKS